MENAGSSPNGEESERPPINYTYSQNVLETKYRRKSIDVLLIPGDRVDDDDNDYISMDSRTILPSRYHGRPRLSDYMSTQVQRHAEASEVEEIMRDHFHRSKPLKIENWVALRIRGSTSFSCLDSRGDLMSFDDLVDSLPKEALDAEVTVQTKPLSSDNGAVQRPRCKLCTGNIVDGTTSLADGESPPTEEEIRRHNTHVVDSILTVAPVYQDDTQCDLFYGHEDQSTVEMKLGDVLSDSGIPFRTYIAQENLFSNRGADYNSDSDEYSDNDSDEYADYDSDSDEYSDNDCDEYSDDDPAGVCITKEGGVELLDGSSNSSPLAMLLPWIRVPSFLLPTDDDSCCTVEVKEINLWLCMKESRTNTHYDGHHNLLMVLSGTKVVELSPPGAFRGSPVHSDHANHPYLLRCTQVGGHLVNEHFRSDVCRATLGARGDNIVVPVTAGEAIFIPEGWWHRVESSAKCMAINVWFDHRGSSVSAMARKSNQHMLPYQAREMVRQYIHVHIEQMNAERAVNAIIPIPLLHRHGFGHCLQSHDDGLGIEWKCSPGREIKELLETMAFGRIFPVKRTRKEIECGMQIIYSTAACVLNADLGPEPERSATRKVPTLQCLVIPSAITSLALMINFFIVHMRPGEEGGEGEEDREAIILLLKRLPAATTETKRFLFSELIKRLIPESCYNISIAWEKHRPVAEAQESFTNLFGRCEGDEARKRFFAQVDEFRGESAKRLILGDLMLINPETT